MSNRDYTQCPICGDTDYYYGLWGDRCSNPGCPQEGSKRKLPSNGRIPGFIYFEDQLQVNPPVNAWVSKKLQASKSFKPIVVLKPYGKIEMATTVAPANMRTDEVEWMVDNKVPGNLICDDLKCIGQVIAFKADVRDIPPHGNGFEYGAGVDEPSKDAYDPDEDVPF